MKVAVQLPVDRVDLGDEFVSFEGVSEIARSAQDYGFSACYVTDHPVPASRWLEQGGHHSFDPFVALSFAAAATDTLKLFTNILVLAYRNPFLTAKSIASLDAMSGGRVIVGVGAGYLKGEFEALGVDFSERGVLTDESILAMKQAWTGEHFSVAGQHFNASGNQMLPRPLQRPHPPIWIGGNSHRAIRRAVELGDGWLPFPVKGKMASHTRTSALATMDDLRDKITYAKDYADSIGRTAALEICMVPFGLDMHSDQALEAEPIIEQCRQLQDLGVGWISLSLPCDSRSQYIESLQWFAESVLIDLE